MRAWLVSILLIACGSHRRAPADAAPERLHLNDLRALDAQRALVLIDGLPQGAVAEVDASGQVRWRSEVPGDAAGLLVTRERVIVRYLAGGEAGAAAYGLDGAPQWTAALGAADELMREAFAQDAGAHVIEWTTGKPRTAWVLDAATGAVAHRYDDPGDGPLIDGDFLIVHAPTGATALPLGQGDPIALPTLGDGCVIDGEYVGFDGTRVIGFRDLHAAPRVIASDLGFSSPPTLWSCGRRADRLVLLFTTGPINDLVESILEVDPAGASTRLELHRGDLMPVPMRWNSVGLLTGELSRFVSFPALDVGHRVARIELLDLDGPAIAWRSQPQPLDDLMMSASFHADTIGYQVLGKNLLAFDLTAGALRGAIAEPDTLDGPGPASVAAGRLWFYNTSQAPVLVVDAALTASPDVTSQMRTALGAP